MPGRQVIASVLVVVLVACSGAPRVRRAPAAVYTQDTRWYDAIDLATGRKYEVLTRTAWNLELHGRRMAGVFFRMISF